MALIALQTPAHSPWDCSAHLHRTSSPSTSATDNMEKIDKIHYQRKQINPSSEVHLSYNWCGGNCLGIFFFVGALNTWHHFCCTPNFLQSAERLPHTFSMISFPFTKDKSRSNHAGDCPDHLNHKNFVQNSIAQMQWEYFLTTKNINLFHVFCV